MLNIQDLAQPDVPGKDNYGEALKIGLDSLGAKPPRLIADLAGAAYEGNKIILPHLDREIILDIDSRRITTSSTGADAPIWLAILAVHYLNNADGTRPSGKLKHFREFRDGLFYEPAFNKKTKTVLIQVFGRDPRPMIVAGEKLKGKRLDSADASVELAYFPFLPITCLVWEGDEEFPPEAGVLFDETAFVFFSAEDMAVAGQMAVLELLKACGPQLSFTDTDA
ncbi:MAG: DUF3786 domain-containing protein [Pseudomonadota bacterium]